MEAKKVKLWQWLGFVAVAGLVVIGIVSAVSTLPGCKTTTKPPVEDDEFTKVISGEVYWGKYAVADNATAVGWLMNDDGAKGFVHVLMDVPPELEAKCRMCKYNGKLKLRSHSRNGFMLKSAVVEVIELTEKEQRDH